MEMLGWKKNFNDVAPYRLSEFESKGNNIWHFELGGAPSEYFLSSCYQI